MSTIDKSILKKYLAAQGRIKLLLIGIKKLHKMLLELETKNEVVIDCVKGTRKDGTYGAIRISGFPEKEYKEIKEKLKKREEILKAAQLQLLELTNEAELYINSIKDPEVQSIFDLHYFNNKTWLQISHDMNFKYGIKGKVYTKSSCRHLHDRYLKNNL